MKQVEEVEIDDGISDSPHSSAQTKKHAEMIEEPRGWNLFSEEVAWYVYDFFKWELNGYEKILFYSYFINGMTLDEIALADDYSYEGKNGEWVYKAVSHQYIAVQIKKIEKKMAYRWKNRTTWGLVKHDCK